MASLRPGQLGPENLHRGSGQTDRPKLGEGRAGPAAERPQLLQRSGTPVGLHFPEILQQEVLV